MVPANDHSPNSIAQLLFLPTLALDESTSPLKESRKTLELEQIKKEIEDNGKTICVIDGLVWE